MFTDAPDQITPGIYLYQRQVEWLWFYALVDNSPEPPVVPVTSGRLDLRSLDASEAEGSVDLQLMDDTRIAGDFVAPRCH